MEKKLDRKNKDTEGVFMHNHGASQTIAHTSERNAQAMN